VGVLLYLVGILFPHINDDARSKSHQVYGPIFLELDDDLMSKITKKDVRGLKVCHYV